MALIKCKDCDKEFSTDAKRCPHCGANPPSSNGGCLKPILIGIFTLVVIGTLLNMGEQAQPHNPQDYVMSYCREFIKESLHDPSSADFDPVFPKPTVLADNKFEVVLPLRAKNGFGALRHFAVDCIVRANGDSLSLVKLREIN